MKNIYLLILDDEKYIRENFAEYFEDEGYEIDKAGSVEAALNLVKKNNYDVAIVDIRLPNINGDKFIEMANRIDPKIKFLIQTGTSNFKLDDNLIKIGITKNDLFIKPIIDLDQIKNRISKLLREVNYGPSN